MSRILDSFAFAACCLYPEFVMPLLTLNETVSWWSKGTRPEKEAA